MRISSLRKLQKLRRVLKKKNRGSFKFSKKSKRVATKPSKWYKLGQAYARRELKVA